MKLFDVIEKFIPGDWGDDNYSTENCHAVHCVRGADFVPIESHDYSEIPIRFISSRSFNSKLLKQGDIIIEKSGGSPTQSTGRVSFVSSNLMSSVNEELVCSNFCVAFRCKEEWNPLYVYFYIKFIYNLGIFFNFEGKTSGLKNLQTEIALKSIPIRYIEKSEQDRIARIFQNIDNNIATLRAINSELNNLARHIFTHWFLQYDFPDESGNPYKTSGGEMVFNEILNREIPKGWQVSKIREVCDLNKEAYTTKNLPSSIVYLDTSNLTRNVIDSLQSYVDSSGAPSRARKKVKDETVIYSSVRPNQEHYGIILNPSDNLVVSTGYVTIDVKDRNIVSPYQIYLFLSSEFVIQYLQKIAESSVSSYPSINSEDIGFINIEYPSDDKIIQKFNSLCRDIYDKINNNLSTINELERFADTFLPHFMVGQVKVN